MSRMSNRIRACLAAGSKVAIFCWSALATAVPASADGPGREFKQLTDETNFRRTRRSIARGAIFEKRRRMTFLHQFWTFDRKRQDGTLLNRGEDADLAGYAAGFRFSPDSQWLVRMQKTRRGLSHAVFVPAKWLLVFIGDLDARSAISPGTISSACL